MSSPQSLEPQLSNQLHKTTHRCQSAKPKQVLSLRTEPVHDKTTIDSESNSNSNTKWPNLHLDIKTTSPLNKTKLPSNICASHKRDASRYSQPPDTLKQLQQWYKTTSSLMKSLSRLKTPSLRSRSATKQPDKRYKRSMRDQTHPRSKS